MVGSYVVAWEVRTHAPSRRFSAARGLAPERACAALQERVTKEVADLEAKRAKRFAGARGRGVTRVLCSVD